MMDTSRRGLFKLLGAAAVVPLVERVGCGAGETLEGVYSPLKSPPPLAKIYSSDELINLMTETNELLGDLTWVEKK